MRRTLRLTLLCCLPVFAAGLSGCATFPELDAVQTPGVADAPYPRLLPLEDLLNGPAPRASAAAIASVEGRVAALRARAERLQRARIAPQDVETRLARLRQKAAELRAQ